MQRVGQQKSCGLDFEQLSTSLREAGQQLDDVEIVEQAVDERHDGGEHAGFARSVSHIALLPGMCLSPIAHQSASIFSRRSRMSRATSVALRPVA